MKHLQLMNKLALVFIVLCAFSCDKDPCFDIPELDRLSAETKEWYVNDSIGNETITDKNGISQTLTQSQIYSGGYENSSEDGCGNTYGSFRFSIQYHTSVSPLHFMVDIHGDGAPGNGFYLKLETRNLQTNDHNTTTYDFVTKSPRDNDAAITYLEQFQIEDKVYEGVLKITFQNTFYLNNIKTVFYAKGYGIVKFTQENGNEFEVN